MMEGLIVKLEAAKEGSRELDLKIGAEISPHNETIEVFARRFWDDSLPHYTTSLDAALTLVPEGWRAYAIQQDGHWDESWFAGLDQFRGGGVVNSRHFTPALALCIAALKART